MEGLVSKEITVIFDDVNGDVKLECEGRQLWLWNDGGAQVQHPGESIDAGAWNVGLRQGFYFLLTGGTGYL